MKWAFFVLIMNLASLHYHFISEAFCYTLFGIKAQFIVKKEESVLLLLLAPRARSMCVVSNSFPGVRSDISKTSASVSSGVPNTKKQMKA